MLNVKNLSGGYGTSFLVTRIHFDLKPQENLFLIGPNGSGKTTLFKLILGLIDKNEGEISIDGKILNKPIDSAHRVAYIPQIHEQPFDYSVFEMVLMGRSSHINMFSNASTIDIKITENAIALLGITHLRDKSFNKLSGGEMKMVLIARSICQQAKIIVMDEPYANLDYKNQAQLSKAIHSLNKEGFSFIISTHNVSHINIKSSVLLIKNGKQIHFGAAYDILNNDTLTTLFETPMRINRINSENGDVQFVCT